MYILMWCEHPAQLHNYQTAHINRDKPPKRDSLIDSLHIRSKGQYKRNEVILSSSLLIVFQNFCSYM